MTTSWHSYPSIYNMGHAALANLFEGPVVVEEKIDGSQFSFGRFEFTDEHGEYGQELRIRSKGCQMNITYPEKMFDKAAQTVRDLDMQLTLGYTYRAEFLASPRHNTLCYERCPEKHLIIFDINDGHESYLSYEDKLAESNRLGLECVPKLEVTAQTNDAYRHLLEHTSILGRTQIEGFVVKNYTQFGRDKKVLMGKFVSERFKEVHSESWKQRNPGKDDIIDRLVEQYTTTARWHKAVQHLREAGTLEDSPRDIPLLLQEVSRDVHQECGEEIKQQLFDWVWKKKLCRGVTCGLPEWYKEQLLAKQFEREGA